MNEVESAAGHDAHDDATPAPSTLRSPRPRRSADSGSFPALTAPITVRARRFSSPERSAADSSRSRAASPSSMSFPHRLAAPAFGAILSGVLTYCLHQWGEPTPAHARLVRARTTYAAEGVVAEPVRFEVELPDSAPVERAAPPRATRTTAAPLADRGAPAVTERASGPDAVEASSQLPVVRPIELRFAPERPSRALKATTRARKKGAREASTRRRGRSRS